MGMLLARRGQSGEKEGKGQAGRALRAAAVLAALALLGASPAPEGRERISRGEVLARAPGRLVEQREDRLCFEDGKGRYTRYFFDGQGRLCRLARLEPRRAPCVPGQGGKMVWNGR